MPPPLLKPACSRFPTLTKALQPSLSTALLHPLTLLCNPPATTPLQRSSTPRLSPHCPGLVLLCHELELSCRQLSHLYRAPAEVPLLPPALLRAAATEYLTAAHPLNARQALTDAEAARTMGHRPRRPPPGRRPPPFGALPAEPCSAVPEGFIAAMEEQLAAMLTDGPAPGPAPPFPLDAGLCGGSPLAQRMVRDLAKSWDAYHTVPAQTPSAGPPARHTALQALGREVREARGAAEAHVTGLFARLPCTRRDGWHGPAFRMRQAANLVPEPRLLDIMTAAWDPDTFAVFNPFLSRPAQQALRADVQLWLALCVLEDKIARLLALGDADPALLQAELRARRTWDPAQHPKWLALEVFAVPVAMVPC